MAALSGGADSVALLDALLIAAPTRRFRVVAAHLDHQLRPSSSEDARFCAHLCESLGVRLQTGRADVRARARRDGGGIEEAARVERYAFLRSVKDAERATFIAVAHTRDDQAETFLLRLLRGAGSTGLAAMKERSGDLLRPLLGVSREDVLAHLGARGLEWREDPSNDDRAFLRNRVRRELLPYLESNFNPKVRETLARTAALLADEDGALTTMADELGARAARREGFALVLTRAALAEAPRAVGRAAIRKALDEVGGRRGVSALHVERILELARAPFPSGRRVPLPGAREAVFSFDEVILGPRREAARPFEVPLAVPGRVALPGGGCVESEPLHQDETPGSGDATGSVVAVPVAGSLTVRTRRPGDRVRTGGRQASLKRFLMDRHVASDLRGSLPLVTVGNQVLWIAGQPLEDDRGSDRDGCRLVRLRLTGTPEVNSGVPTLARSQRDRGAGTPEVNSGVPTLARSQRDRGAERDSPSRAGGETHALGALEAEQ